MGRKYSGGGVKFTFVIDLHGPHCNVSENWYTSARMVGRGGFVAVLRILKHIGLVFMYEPEQIFKEVI